MKQYLHEEFFPHDFSHSNQRTENLDLCSVALVISVSLLFRFSCKHLHGSEERPEYPKQSTRCFLDEMQNSSIELGYVTDGQVKKNMKKATATIL